MALDLVIELGLGLGLRLLRVKGMISGLEAFEVGVAVDLVEVAPDAGGGLLLQQRLEQFLARRAEAGQRELRLRLDDELKEAGIYKVAG